MRSSGDKCKFQKLRSSYNVQLRDFYVQCISSHSRGTIVAYIHCEPKKQHTKMFLSYLQRNPAGPNKTWCVLS